MIPLGIWMIGNTFERAMKSTVDQASELVAFNRRFEAYVLTMERRMTLVEDRQARVLLTLEAMAVEAHAKDRK